MNKLWGYTTTHNALEVNIPVEASIRNHLQFCDVVVVTDGGSCDGTLELLYDLKKEFVDRLLLFRNKWDWNRCDMDGVQKTFSRRQCKGDWLWQFDVDEFVPAMYQANIRTWPRNYPGVILFNFPCLTFHGGMRSTSVNESHHKWRLSRNVPWLMHGVPARFWIEKDGSRFFYREDSDSCEYIDANGDIQRVFNTFDEKLHYIGQQAKKMPSIENVQALSDVWHEILRQDISPVIFHYSWIDYYTKHTMRSFWGRTKRFFRSKQEEKFLPDFLPQTIQPAAIFNDAIKDSANIVVPIDVPEHPKEIMKFARQRGWPMHFTFDDEGRSIL